VTQITVTETTSPPVTPAITIQACPSNSVASECRKIKVLTDKARPSGGSELHYKTVVKTMSAEREFLGKIAIDCSKNVKIINPNVLSNSPMKFGFKSG